MRPLNKLSTRLHEIKSEFVTRNTNCTTKVNCCHRARKFALIFSFSSVSYIFNLVTQEIYRNENMSKKKVKTDTEKRRLSWRHLVNCINFSIFNRNTKSTRLLDPIMIIVSERERNFNEKPTVQTFTLPGNIVFLILLYVDRWHIRR